MKKSANGGIGIKRKLTTWDAWNHPHLMMIVSIATLVISAPVALIVAPEYAGSQIMEHALMAIIMLTICAAITTIAAIID